MKIIRKRRQGSWVLHLVGPLARGKQLSLLRAMVGELTRRGQPRIVLDLTSVAYLDAAGIGELVRCHRQACAAGSQLILAGGTSNVIQILRIAKVVDQVPLATTVDDALRILRRSRRRIVQQARRAGMPVHERIVASSTKGPAIIRRTTEGPWRFTPIHG